MWRKQLELIHKTLDLQEKGADILRGIDSKIIADEYANLIFSFAKDSISSLLNQIFGVTNVEIHLITENINNMEALNQLVTKEKYDQQYNVIYKAVLTKGISGKSIFIKGVLCCFNVLNTSDIESFRSHFEELLNSVGQQLNVCLQSRISNNISTLYRDIITRFSKTNEPDEIFDSICSNFVNIYPDVEVFNFEQKRKKIRAQILRKVDDKRLRIIGSTDEDAIGGYVDIDSSICGSLFGLTYSSAADLPRGYYHKKVDGFNTVFYLCNPENNPLYIKTLPGKTYKSELAMLLYGDNGEPFGAINLESTSEGNFSYIHAKVLANFCKDFGFLVENLIRMMDTKKDLYEGLFMALDSYMTHVIREFRHQTNQPLYSFSSAIGKLENYYAENNIRDNKGIIKLMKDGFQELKNAIEMHNKSLQGFLEIRRTIDLKEKVQEVLEVTEFKDVGIDVQLNIPDGLPHLRLDNLFNQFFYDLLQNSIQSIKTKKENMLTLGRSYFPLITISAEHANPFTLKESSKKFVVQKCKVSIRDNGIGLEREKLDTLGEKGVFYQKDGNGIGLFAFKQYLMVHNGYLFIDSEVNEWFEVSFIVDYYLG